MSPRCGYKPREDLERTARREPATGKIVAELKFVFWQTMFTASNHTRVWRHRIADLLPNAGAIPGDPSEEVLRQRVYDDLDVIRDVRNRMAHHEPVHSRDLAGDLQRMLDLIDLRCTATGQWVRDMAGVSALLPLKP